MTAQPDPAPAGGPPDDTHASAPENRRALRVIETYDINGDGKVTEAEITGDQKRFFDTLDVNGDGKLTMFELKRRPRALCLFLTTSLFDILDANGDGTLSAKEIQGPSQRWFRRFDTNRNGVLEYSEVPSRPQRRRRGRGRGRGRLVQ